MSLSFYDWSLMALWKKMAQPPSPKKEIRTPQYRRSPRNLKYSQVLATRQEKNVAPHKKKIFVGRGEYIPWKITIQIQTTTNLLGYKTKSEKFQNYKRNHFSFFFFFCLRYLFTIFYTGSLKVPPQKNQPHLKCQFPPKIPI